MTSLSPGFATHKWQVVFLFITFGVFYAIDESQVKAFIAEIETQRLAGAIDVYNFVTGLIYFPASAIAGVFWTIRPTYAFGFSAASTLVAAIVFVFLAPHITKTTS